MGKVGGVEGPFKSRYIKLTVAATTEGQLVMAMAAERHSHLSTFVGKSKFHPARCMAPKITLECYSYQVQEDEIFLPYGRQADVVWRTSRIACS